MNHTREEANELFNSLDQNRDGRIGLDEFVAGFRWLSKVMVSSQISKTYFEGVIMSDASEAVEEDEREVSCVSSYSRN